MLPLLFFRLGSYPPAWYDEGVNTHTANVLLNFGTFGTYTVRGINPFDPAVTTGPTVLMPVALLFKVAGPGMFQARIISALYAMLAVGMLYLLLYKSIGFRGALFSVLVFLAIPPISDTGFLLFGRQVLGESASFALILVGLAFWFKEWETNQVFWSVLAGFIFGLACISKLQSSIPVVAAIVGLGLLKYAISRSRASLRILLAPGVALILIAAWILLPNIAYASSFQAENQRDSIDAVRLLILPGFWNRNITRGGLFILGGMALTSVICALELRKTRRIRQWAPREWLLAFFGLMTLTGGLWWSLLSIGWVRYTYFGWLAALVILSVALWAIFQWLLARLRLDGGIGGRVTYLVVITGLIGSTLLIHGLPILKSPLHEDARVVADYIHEHVDDQSVIESWDWQVDALSGHWKYSHPPQAMLLSATRQQFVEHNAFNLPYDLLHADPDYLLTGPFSVWTGIYSPQIVASHFNEVFRSGPYTLWARIQDMSDIRE